MVSLWHHISTNLSPCIGQFSLCHAFKHSNNHNRCFSKINWTVIITIYTKNKILQDMHENSVKRTKTTFSPIKMHKFSHLPDNSLVFNRIKLPTWILLQECDSFQDITMSKMVSCWKRVNLPMLVLYVIMMWWNLTYVAFILV